MNEVENYPVDNFSVDSLMIDFSELADVFYLFYVVKSTVKYNRQLNEEFNCVTGVRQGDCLPSFYWRFILII